MKVERRRHPRVRVALTGETLGEVPVLPVTVNDISLGGFSCITASFVPVGTKLEISLTLPFEEVPQVISLRGKVLRIKPEKPDRLSRRYGVALSFLDPEGEDLPALGCFLEKFK